MRSNALQGIFVSQVSLLFPYLDHISPSKYSQRHIPAPGLSFLRHSAWTTGPEEISASQEIACQGSSDVRGSSTHTDETTSAFLLASHNSLYCKMELVSSNVLYKPLYGVFLLTALLQRPLVSRDNNLRPV